MPCGLLLRVCRREAVQAPWRRFYVSYTADDVCNASAAVCGVITGVKRTSVCFSKASVHAMIQASPGRALLPARVRINVPGVQLDDIHAILNMRDAWRFLMGSIDEPVTLEYLCKLNEFIARNEALEWGKLRTGSVAISGTDYTPPVPQEAAVRVELAAILAADTSATEKALTAFCWGTRGQLFWDGNKRTSLTLANKILLQAGAGVLTVRDQNMEQFNEALLNYYNTAEAEPLKAFLYENAIQGLELHS